MEAVRALDELDEGAVHALDVLLPDKALHAGNAPGDVTWHAALHLRVDLRFMRGGAW